MPNNKYFTCDDRNGQILRIGIDNGSPIDVYLQSFPEGFSDGESSALNVMDVKPAWWEMISGLTPIKYFDGRYSGQSAGQIAAWDDLVGGADAVEVIPAQNPVLNSSGFSADNGQYVDFTPSGGATPDLLRCNSLATGLTIPYTLFAVLKHGIIDGTVKNIVGMSTGGGLQWYTQGANSFVWLQDDLGGTQTFNNANAGLSTTRTSLHAVCVNGANSFLWDNGVRQNGSLVLASGYAPTVANIGAYSTTQNGLVAQLRSLIGFNGVATQAQIESVFAGLCGQVPMKIVCEGDSLTAGVGGTPYPTQLATALSDYSWVENHGDGGDTLSVMIAEFAADILPEITATLRTNVVIWAGTNDIYYGADGLTTIARMWHLADLCRRAGARVTLCSMIPRVSFGAVEEGYRADFNNALAQGWRAHADAVVYLHRITGLSTLNPTFFVDDLIHLNSDGYRLVASAIAQSCRALARYV